jgi:hypothetical protein
MTALAIPSQFLTFLIFLIDGCQDADLCVPGVAGGFSILAGILFIVNAISLSSKATPPVHAVLSIANRKAYRKSIG